MTKEVQNDALTDLPRETLVDVPRETLVDVPRETLVDVSRETLVDVPRETLVDVPRETLVDVPRGTLNNDDTQSENQEPRTRKTRKTRTPREPRTVEQLLADGSGLTPTEPVEKPRKRKKASGNADTLASVLGVLHTTLFTVIGAAELDLTKDENQKLAGALDELAEQYEVTVDSKTAAWINLAMVAGGIYGTRAFIIYQASKNEKVKI